MNLDINNIQLSDGQINLELKGKIQKIELIELIQRIIRTKSITKNLLFELLDGDILNNKIDDKFDLINPLHWEFGHVISFWINKCYDLIIKNLKLKIILKNDHLYDSFRTSKEMRFDLLYSLDKVKELNQKYDYCINNLMRYLLEEKSHLLDSDITYIIMLSLLHNEMHNESFCFSRQLLSLPKPNANNLFNTIDRYLSDPIKIDFVNISGGSFMQGWNDNESNFAFDNEKPEHLVKIKSFSMSKHKITQYQYILFIENNGYTNKEYWTPEGWFWKEKNNISLPQYWRYNKEKNVYQRKKWNKWVQVEPNLPIFHISWYEAMAFAKWMNCRLPTESEWEFMSTNKGKNKFPWGDSNPNKSNSNINYYLDGPCDVDIHNGVNKFNIEGLIGNVWEWCMEPIYPYDGFKIDPIYREMSYPFFGYKRVCRGGSWCVADYLINSKYRNAQTPDCRIQYIGFRIVKL